MTISKKKKVPNCPPLIMDGTVLEEVKEHKPLEVTFSNNLSWKAHIEEIVVNAG